MAFGQENIRLEEFFYVFLLGFQCLAYCQISVYQVGTTNPELAEVKKTRVLEDFVYFYSVEQDLEISKNQVLNAQHWFGSISDHFLQQAQISQHLLSKTELHPPFDEIDFRSCFYSSALALSLHLGGKTAAQESGRETLLPPMYNTSKIFRILTVDQMAMIGTRGKLRMVKAMTGKAMPRIRLLEEKKLQWESGKNTEAPESVVLASKACDNVESRQPEEQQPGAVDHLQHEGHQYVSEQVG